MERKTLLVITFALVFAIGCGVNVVRVFTENTVSTGWYDQNGDVVTTHHGHVGIAAVKSRIGYEDDQLRLVSVSGDVAKYRGRYIYAHKRCYAEAAVGNVVGVSTWHGITWTRVSEKNLTTYVINTVLRAGDSGAPVTYKGCVIGIVRAQTKKGVIVMRLGRNAKRREF